MRWLTASAIGLAACGHVGFDAHDPEPPPVPIPLACGDTRAIADLPAVPLGIGLVATEATAVVAWSGGAPAAGLDGVRLELDRDQLAVVESWSTSLPEPVGAFSLAADGDARYLVSAQVAAGALTVPLDDALAAGAASALQPGAMLAPRAIAEPIAEGGKFAAATLENGEATFSLLDDSGAATGTVYRRPATGEVSIHRGNGRHIVTWKVAGGCAVWAFDAMFAPVRPDPLVHGPGGECLRASITRHETGVNLLAWIDGGAVHAQLGTDTDTIGGKLVLNNDPDDLEIAVSPTGFLAAIPSGATIETSYIPATDNGFRTRPPVPHVPGTPMRLVPNRNGALLASIGKSATALQLWITRLCEP